jgi:hypothetical protein
MNLTCKLCGHESTRDDPVQDESLLPPIVYPVCVRILLCQERMIKKIKEENIEKMGLDMPKMSRP